jgi:hypothetical protein
VLKLGFDPLHHKKEEGTKIRGREKQERRRREHNQANREEERIISKLTQCK